MKALFAALALAGCAVAPSLEQQRLASPAPEIASCAQWFDALDREVTAAGARDLRYAAVPGFPYLRADAFLASSRDKAARSAAAFAAFADRLLEHDLESRRNEIDNLPAAVVEKWSGMRFDDSRGVALKRSVQCGHLLRDEELARPEWRAALLANVVGGLAPAAGRACPPFVRGAGAVVRFAPPPAAVSRATAAGWLLRGERDPLAQPVVSGRQLDDLAALYAPSLELVVASDDDRFGVPRRRRGAARPEIDATQPTIYVERSYLRYGERALLQIVYTVFFPGNRVTWRVTLAPDGEPLVYDGLAADGCHTVTLTPRARPRETSGAPPARLPRVRDGERPLLAIAAGSHAVRSVALVQGTDSLARYALRPYDELRAAASRPALGDGLAARFAFELAEPRP